VATSFWWIFFEPQFIIHKYLMMNFCFPFSIYRR
jgi:hypothetical protein